MKVQQHVRRKFIQAMRSVYGVINTGDDQVVYPPDFGRDFIRMGLKNAKTS